MQTFASTVGVQINLLENAHKPDSQIKVMVLIMIIKTRVKSRLFRSSKGGLISPLLQNFLTEHQ